MFGQNDRNQYYNFNNNELASFFFLNSMKWHHSFTRKFTILNHNKLLKNLKTELIKYPIKRLDNKNLN